MRVLQIDHHRNGVGGASFYAVIFEVHVRECSSCGANLGDSESYCVDHERGGVWYHPVRLVAVVFDEPRHVAVFDVDKLANADVGVRTGNASVGNSWRGSDCYERELRAATIAWERERAAALRRVTR